MCLRDKMVIVEDPVYTREYLEADKRSIANAIQCFSRMVRAPAKWSWNTRLAIVAVVPTVFPLLEDKFKANLARDSHAQRSEEIFALCKDQEALEATTVNRFVDLFVI